MAYPTKVINIINKSFKANRIWDLGKWIKEANNLYLVEMLDGTPKYMIYNKSANLFVWKEFNELSHDLNIVVRSKSPIWIESKPRSDTAKALDDHMDKRPVHPDLCKNWKFEEVKELRSQWAYLTINSSGNSCYTYCNWKEDGENREAATLKRATRIILNWPICSISGIPYKLEAKTHYDQPEVGQANITAGFHCPHCFALMNEYCDAEQKWECEADRLRYMDDQPVPNPVKKSYDKSIIMVDNDDLDDLPF